MSLDKEKLNNFIEDLKFLATKPLIEHTELNTLKQLLKTENIKEYLDIVPQVKPESAMSDKIITPLLEAMDIRVSPQVNTGSSWVDYAISTAYRNPVGLEVKPMFVATDKTKTTAKLKINKLDDIFNDLKNEFIRDKKNQITLYLRKYDYIIFTNGVDVFYFNRDAIASFNYFYRETFVELAEKMRTNKNIHDVVAKIEEEKFIGKKKDLDKEFFLDLEQWHKILGDVKWKGDENEINRAKIALLDKLIFTQTLEDYSLVPFKIMINKFEDKEQMWKTKGSKRVVEEFMSEIDNWFYTYYDTELFKENILEHLEDSEENYGKFLETFKWIIGLGAWETVFRKGLGHYNYRYIDEDIFGKAYETFLAENRKEEGIYYTPRNITDYMAENVVNEVFKEDKNKLIELLNHNPTEKEFEEAKQIARRLISKGIIDIASGSGSFLIKVLRKTYGIYEEIDKTTEWATKGALSFNEPEDVMAFRKKVLEIRKIIGIYGDSSALKRRLVSLIILRHIYGIDLDRGAVEVAKANLWKEAIKLSPDAFRFEELKGETNHVLPNLTTNLIHGNSILTLPDEEVIKFIEENFKNEIAEIIRLRNKYLEDPEDPTFIEQIAPIKEEIRGELGKKFNLEYPLFYPLEFPQFYFDENGEPLPEEERGFNGVIGNPPYIRIYRENIKEALLNYLKAHYISAFKKFDMYVIFMERGINLVRNGGFMTYIIPDKWLTQPYGEHIRKYTLEHCKIISLTDLTQIKVFKDATVDNFIFLFQKESIKEHILENKIKVIRAGSQFIKEEFVIYDVEQSSLNEKSFNTINIYNNDELLLLEKIRNKSLLLKEIFYVNWGCRPSPKEKFVFKTNLNNKCQPLIVGSNIEKYYISPNHRWVLYDKSMYNQMFKELFENTTIVFKDIIGKRNITAALNTIDYYSDFTVITAIKYDKVASVKRIKIPSDYHLYSFYDEKFILGIVNSKLESFYFNKTLRNGLHTLPNGVKNLLIPKISVEKQKDIISIADQILYYNRIKQGIESIRKNTKLSNPVKNNAINRLDNKLKTLQTPEILEAQIDQLIYKLYGLTDEEIKTIENQDNANS